MSERSLIAAPKAPAVPTAARAGVLQRQCACGNRAVGGACESCKGKKNLQAKLTISEPGDRYEQEADRIVEQIMASGRPAVGGGPLRVQRLSSQPAVESDAAAPASVAQVLTGHGRPLEPALRQDMEQRLGYDLSRVRVHTGSDAGRSARDVNAHAYTVGHDIVFGPGRYAPGRPSGRRLIAHELTHVVQQSGGDVASRSDDGPLPVSRAAAVVQRDDAGGGSTEFEDQVTMMSRPSSGPGLVQGTVTRTETAPAGGGQPRQQIQQGEMHVRFDPADCSVTIPFGYNFVQALQATGTGICDSPPATTKVSPLSGDAFNKLKAGVLSDVNSGLNGWFDVRMTGRACPGGCSDRPLPIRVDAHEDTAHPDTTITVVNRGGRADAATICAASWNRSTAVHEGGHQTLGVGDEYPEKDERLRATVPEWFRPERVRRDYSIMGPEEDSRFAMFHERHFHGVKTFLEAAFPGCTATLEAKPRPFLPSYRGTFSVGAASLSGVSGPYLSFGLGLGIPLDRLRRWEVILGPQLTLMSGSGDGRFTNAFLLGARLGLEGSTGAAGHGFVAGGFAEAGRGWFSSSDYGSGGGGSRSAVSTYGEIGLSAGYRAPLISGSTRFSARIEGAVGSVLDAPGIIGPITREIENDPARSYWFRLGVSFGAEF